MPAEHAEAGAQAEGGRCGAGRRTGEGCGVDGLTLWPDVLPGALCAAVVAHIEQMLVKVSLAYN